MSEEENNISSTTTNTSVDTSNTESDTTSFINFMSSKKDGNKKDNGKSYFKSSTKDSLEKERNKKKEEENKELKEAKSNSIALANRYNKAGLFKAQTKNMIVMIPVILFGVFAFFMLLFNGGTWLNKIINILFNSIIDK